MPKSRKCVNVLKARNSAGAQELRDRIEEVEKLVRFQIKKMGLSKMQDIEDMRQQSIMRCFMMAHNFDPEKFTLATYVCMVTAQSMHERLRYNNTKMRGLFQAISTDTAIHKDKHDKGHDLTIGDMLMCDDVYDEVEDEIYINNIKPRIVEAIKTNGNVKCAERDVDMLIDRYVYGMTYNKIAKKYGLKNYQAVDCALDRVKNKLSKVSEEVFE